MKAFKTLLLLLALGLPAYGQAVNVTANKIKGSATAPSGACSAQSVQLTTAGVVYVCASGTWTSSGGGTTINSTNGQVPYRVNSTTFGDSAFASNALNSTYLSATSGASGAGLTLSVAGGGASENLILTPKGSGNVLLPTGSAAAPSMAFNGDSNTGFYNSIAGRIQAVLSASHHTLFWSNGLAVQVGQITVGAAINVGIVNQGTSTSILRITNASTGAGQLLVGTSTDTADAQLSVYSQSTTRPGLKLRALSGTAGSQNVFESYNAAGTTTFSVTADGSATINTATIGTANMSAAQTNSIQRLSGGGANIYTSAGANTISIGGSTTPIAIGGNAVLYGDAANVLSLQNSTNAQAFRVYNTYTSGSNYERLGIQASSNAFFITPEAATGTVRELVTGAAGSVTRIRSSLATPSAPSLADGDWWVECTGSSPSRVCAIMVRDGGATRTIASMTY